MKARETAQRNSCINQLRMMDSAKQQWALEKGEDATATPTETDIAPYLGRSTSPQQWLICPAGGTYEIHAMNELPTCSRPGHAMEP